MRRSSPPALVFALVLGSAALALAQGPPIPRPGPEHEVLKRDVGTWDATVEIVPGPGMSPITASGVETNTLFAGRWLLTEYTSEMMGQPFEGHGMSGWDSQKKVYVSTWADTMATGISRGEATFDAATNTMTGWMEIESPAGGTVRVKTVATWPTDDERVVKTYMPETATEPYMTMTYPRRP
jgi:Protein of unknown function (DUF1579)